RGPRCAGAAGRLPGLVFFGRVRAAEPRWPGSAAELDPRGCVVAGTLPRARLAIDARGHRRPTQRVGHQGEVDAQAEVAAEGGLAIVPPAEDAAFVAVQPEAIVQPQVEQRTQRVALRAGGQDVALVPDRGIVHVALVGRDVEVA